MGYIILILESQHTHQHNFFEFGRLGLFVFGDVVCYVWVGGLYVLSCVLI